MGSSEGEPRVFRVGGMSYLRIPAPDPVQLASFYEAVFGWRLGGNPAQPSFEDGTGHVIGHFVDGVAVAGDAGFIPYVFVASIDEALDRATVRGGEVETEPYPEGDLWVARCRDPAGNVVGVWQRSPREHDHDRQPH
jgi:predicted enzyme related to lactoylglutathione lyase